MRRNFPILAAFLITTACHVREQANDNAVAHGDSEASPPLTPTAAGEATVDPSTPPPVHLNPDAPPLPADTSEQGAVRRALEYCDALATRRFDDAYDLWVDGGRGSGITLAEFRDKFADVKVSDCQLSEAGPMEGAAGSIYIEVPAVIRGTTKAGRPLRIEGPIVLKRVNDVPGSTAEQRRWHVARAEFPNL